MPEANRGCSAIKIQRLILLSYLVSVFLNGAGYKVADVHSAEIAVFAALTYRKRAVFNLIVAYYKHIGDFLKSCFAYFIADFFVTVVYLCFLIS